MYLQRKDLLFIDKRNKRAIAIKEIVMLKGDINYTYFYLRDGRCQLSARTLKYYEKQLLDNGFLRVHRGAIINIACVVSTREGAVEMSNGEEIAIARRRKNRILQLFGI